MIRSFVNGAPLLMLAAPGVNDVAVTLPVASTAGYPDSTPFTLAIERATVNEEVVLCTAKTATDFTVERGWNGTVGKPHAPGSAIEHTSAAADYGEANAHVNDVTTDVHSQYLLKAAYAAKGRIIIGTGAGTFTALAVGADNYVALADATQASGVKWGQIVAASIVDGTIDESKLTASVIQSIIAKQSGAPTAVDGRVYFDSGVSRWYGYVGSWYKMTFGAGLISWGMGAPSGGSDGDIYFRLG